MKMRMFLMIFVAAVLVAVLTPAVQAVVLDSFTYGEILLETTPPEGRWLNNRDYLDLEESSTITHDADGSVVVPFEDFTGNEWDNDVLGNFHDASFSVGVNDSFTFWSYRPAAGAGGSEHIREIQVYSHTGDELPDAQACAIVVAECDAEDIAVGWTQYTIARSDFVTTDGTIDWDCIDLINFFVTCWASEEVTPGNWVQVDPTAENLYIDDLQLIPEPATMSLLALGTLALLKRRKA